MNFRIVTGWQAKPELIRIVQDILCSIVISSGFFVSKYLRW